jgi:acyl-CoA thioester hydrolase
MLMHDENALLLRNEVPYRVRYADTDQMGYMYNGHYLRLFEIGRTELLRQAGVPYRQLEEQGLLLPVLEAHVRYHAPAYYDDVLTIVTTYQPRYGATLRLEYTICRSDVVLADGYTIHSFVSKEHRRAVRPPAWFIERLTKSET